MADYPLVSIIVPIYKVEKYLNECVDSLLAQTYPNIELILVDDGSPDKCPQICDEYASKHTNITVIHKKNGGISAARNDGFALAKGEYISFFDSDDWADADYIETLYDLMQKHDAQLGCCNQMRHEFKANGTKVYPRHKVEGEDVVLSSDEAIKQNLSFGFIRNFVQDKLYRRELLEGLSFPTDIKYEDVVHTGSVLLRAKTIVYTPRTLWHYRIHQNSTTHKDLTINYDLLAARGRKMDEISAAKPHLLPLLKKEFVTVFFFALPKIAMSEELRPRNRALITQFKKWLKDNNVSVGRRRQVMLFCVAYLPKGYSIYCHLDNAVMRLRKALSV